ncbi:serine hydrolase [Caenispirillum salinarum]|uniref:serine hydrolase n=1 Tax=Caenispirillum salinarum TaxID=859058 RepID=UPI00384C1118
MTIVAGSADAVARYASIVVDAETGAVLYSRNANQKLYPASLTKMMTLYMLFDQIERGKMTLKTRLPVSERAAGMPPSKLGLKVGESIPVETAIKVLVVKSANDVATVVGEAISGSEWKFAIDMTEKAHSLGMSRTTFKNASGLPNSGQKSTAQDMATLARALMRDFPQYYPYFATTQVTWKGRTLTTHNHVLTRYGGADGLKTGYIRASGFNLAASAVRNGRRIVGVVFGGKTSRWRDNHMIDLLDEGFMLANRLDPVVVPPPGRKPILLADGSVKLHPKTIAALSAPLPEPKPAQAVPGTAETTQAVALASAMPAPKPLVTQPTALASAAAIPPEAQGSADPAQTGDPTVGQWGVQVGAFSRYGSAQTKASEAAERLRPSIEGSHPKIATTKDTGDTIYRARVMGMDEGEAREACNFLRVNRMACIVVPPEQDMARVSRPAALAGN